MRLSGIALRSECWVGAVFQGLFWLEGDGEEGIWLYSVS